MFWKKEQVTKNDTTTTLPLQCNGAGSDCELINELRNLQEELREYNVRDIESRTCQIWRHLFNNPWGRINKEGEFGILMEFVEHGDRCLPYESTIDAAIKDLVEYKELLHKYNISRKNNNRIYNRIKEIKKTLGIE